jgi:hypothetical protein
MRFLTLTLCLSFFLIPSVSKADLFVSGDKKSGATAEKEEKKLKHSERWPGKKSELDEIDPQMKEFANGYYGNCMTKQNSIVQGENLKYLCACSAARIMKSMTVEEAKLIGADSPEGQEQRNHVMLNVYVPCMKAPVEALLYKGCTNDPNTQKSIKNLKEVCGCTAKTMSDHIQEKAPAYIAESLKLNPFAKDPLATFLNSPEYLQKAQANLMGCLQTHELQ